MSRFDVCLSLGNVGYFKVMELIQYAPLVELRMDLLSVSEYEYKSLFSVHSQIVATSRVRENNFNELIHNMKMAIDFGCAYIDIDIHVPLLVRDRLFETAKDNGVKQILSYHNYDLTPSLEDLISIGKEMQTSKADIVKLACFANSSDDCVRVLHLYDQFENIVAFNMGVKGRITRFLAPFLGSPFIYAAFGDNITAPGQIAYDEMCAILNQFENSLCL
ncbi:MAG: type I 3-dehydroquinate dehydratase [Salinivirgaceae bacterium]|nr:type I 3-dehydroquinate dehydratase [Salinivirgaceae bacterium]